jgi:hypothetical protein
MLHTSGIYVFESKNYSGWIYGTESQRTWTQTFSNGQKNHFYNPMKQNSTHIKWLRRLIPDYDESLYHSVIVFSKRCRLAKLEQTTSNHIVINRYDLLSTISKTSNLQVLTKDQIREIYLKLQLFTNVSDEKRTAHVETIKRRHSILSSPIPASAVHDAAHDATHDETESQPNIEPTETITTTMQTEPTDHTESIESTAIMGPTEHKNPTALETVCNRCGSIMINRTATRGEHKGQQFLGCSNFPRCRNIVNLRASTVLGNTVSSV